MYLLNRPSLIEHMAFAPYRLYTPSTLDPAGDEGEEEDEDEGETERLYTEMATGDWWWRTQVSEAL
jgi:Plavaka transposase